MRKTFSSSCFDHEIRGVRNLDTLFNLSLELLAQTVRTVKILWHHLMMVSVAVVHLDLLAVDVLSSAHDP